MANRSNRTSSFYSYTAKRSLRQEEVAAYRRIAIATVIIVGLLVGGYFVFIPLLAGMGSSNNPINTHTPLGTTDNIPPTAPQLASLPDITKTKTLSITGSAESGASVTILVNQQEQNPVLADKNGQFKADVTLQGGENTISATAKDSVGNVSRASKEVTIVYDATPPKLSVTNPSGDTSVSTASIAISGKTDASAMVTINDRQAIVQPDGSFSLNYTLVAGTNTITITSTDSAGNAAKTTRTVTFNNPQASGSATP